MQTFEFDNGKKIMGKIVRIPDSMRGPWATFEKALRKHLRSIGCFEEEANHVLAELKPVYLMHAKPPNISATDGLGYVEALNRWVTQLNTALLLELAMRELDLYRLRKKHGSNDDPRPPQAA